MPRMRSKSDLPTKICPACDRPFAWRRKWARDWENVVYCSKRCSGSGSKGNPDRSTAGVSPSPNGNPGAAKKTKMRA